MRASALIPLLLVAACGDTGDGTDKQAKTKAASLSAGQWELASEVTAFSAVDQGPPRIDTPVGTRATETVCVGEGRLPSVFLTGDGFRCSQDNYYVRNGRLNVTLRCTRDGLDGAIAIAADGRFEADSSEFTREIQTALAGEGDVQISQRVTARRTGDCPADDGAGNTAG